MRDTIQLRSITLKSIQAGELRAKFSARGDRILSYSIDLRHLELDLHKNVTAPELSILQNKVDALLAQWDKKHSAHLVRRSTLAGKELASDLTIDAEARRARLRNTLHATLTIDDAVNWDVLKDHSKYQGTPFGATSPTAPQKPPALPPLKISFFQLLFGQRAKLVERREAEVARADARWDAATRAHLEKVANFDAARAEWSEKNETAKRVFLQNQSAENAKVDTLREQWLAGDPRAIEEHVAIVLEASNHDDAIPKSWTVEFEEDSGTVLLEYELPAPDRLPTAKTHRFITTTGEIKVTEISATEKKAIFDEVCYQLCLRTIHEILEADTPKHINSVLFNGVTESVNPATGQLVRATILSIIVDRATFEAINLDQVDPRTCFKSLKGVSASTLVGLTPIAPLMELSKDDRRFIQPREVSLPDDGGMNLAAMDWEEFEHLVRQVFEMEFASRGGEVRVTQSSSDGGVDAVAFDPDPISGGKIVIQAKRYTKTVGVAAVRDLYGTTMNEGASKGILVTTADYGPDAHKFASDKPLTLLTGSHLLHLLKKHGIKARINLADARRELGLRS